MTATVAVNKNIMFVISNVFITLAVIIKIPF